MRPRVDWRESTNTRVRQYPDTTTRPDSHPNPTGRVRDPACSHRVPPRSPPLPHPRVPPLSCLCVALAASRSLRRARCVALAASLLERTPFVTPKPGVSCALLVRVHCLRRLPPVLWHDARHSEGDLGLDDAAIWVSKLGDEDRDSD